MASVTAWAVWWLALSTTSRSLFGYVSILHIQGKVHDTVSLLEILKVARPSSRATSSSRFATTLSDYPYAPVIGSARPAGAGLVAATVMDRLRFAPARRETSTSGGDRHDA
jgi:hypothetical protein